MGIPICGVVRDSAAYKAAVKAGEKLVSMNGNAIGDVLDYQFYMMEAVLTLRIEDANGSQRDVLIEKEEYEDLGLEFDTYLMDRQRSCKNKCIFCFIDQMPKGMRKSLYFKDDDARLSFLFGNYITLTNLKNEDVDRIIQMRISPINVSVHTTNPQLRVKMMGNPRAGEVLSYIQRLTDSGITVNCQTVLCPGINDGEELKRTLEDLSTLNVDNVACVPVGITDFRQGLYPLECYNKHTAGEVIDIIDAFSDAYEKKYGFRLSYASDEFYLLAGREIPQPEYYGQFSQLENGVGLIASLREEFLEALKEIGINKAVRQVSIATGTAAGDFMKSLVDELRKRWHNLNCKVYSITNEHFGHSITVAGLVTGRDLIAQLKGKPLGNKLLIASSMLKRDEDIFLDDVTLEEVENALGIPVEPVDNDGYALVKALTEAE